ncbi:hypothetical protein HZA55_01560 [Candidatus Poribacteria bacterium]|nr:hypothetical protein [Candidatus Poribacteria bacterium]
MKSYLKFSKQSLMILGVLITAGCSSTQKQVITKPQIKDRYAYVVNNANSNTRIGDKSPYPAPQPTVSDQGQTPSSSSSYSFSNSTTSKSYVIEDKSKKEKKATIETASLNIPVADTSEFVNDLSFVENRFIRLKHVSRYFGERKIKSIIYAVGDFNKWGKDKINKYSVRVENDEALLDLYQLPLLKGTNRIGFTDYSNNIWQLKEDLFKNKLLAQSTNGEWVIGIFVTQDGTLTLFNNSTNGNGNSKLIPER